MLSRDFGRSRVSVISGVWRLRICYQALAEVPTGGAPVRSGLVRAFSALLACFLTALAASAALGAAPALPPLESQPDGSVVVKADTYQALIGPDGNLHSLSVGDTEMIDDRVGISLGAFFYADGPRQLETRTLLGPGALQATDRTFYIQYRFRRREISATITNRGKKSASYFLVLAPHVSIVTNLRTRQAAAVPATEPWGDARFTTPTGAYLELRGGTGIWGPWLRRQVWEVSNLAPGQHTEIRLRAGLSAPPRPAPEQLVSIRAQVTSKGSLAGADQPIALRISADNRSNQPLSALLSVELFASRGSQLIRASSDWELLPKQSSDRLAQFQLQAPDFYTANVTISAQKRELAKAAATAGYRVDEILPTVNAPPDFGAFWERVLGEVDAAPPQFRLTLDEKRSRPPVSVWVLQLESVGGKAIHGWYLHPNGSQARPALLYLSGYGGRPIDPPLELAARGYVVLAIDVRGNRVDHLRPHPFESYCTRGIESPDAYVYREIVAHALRAVRLLASREEVDPSRLAIVGVSEGGGVGLILAALVPELRAVVAAAPMLCDFPLSIRAGAWPYTEIARYLQQHPDQVHRVRTTLSYFDVVNFAPDVKCPVLLSVGFSDRVSLPAAVYGMFNLLGGPKEIRPLPEAGHEGGGADLWSYKLDWLGKLLSSDSTTP
jgi:cephalosporin-C deacetylase